MHRPTGIFWANLTPFSLKSTSSWGGSVIELNNTQNGSREYWMFAAEFANHCDLANWGTNSLVVAAVSSTPSGPYVRQVKAA